MSWPLTCDRSFTDGVIFANTQPLHTYIVTLLSVCVSHVNICYIANVIFTLYTKGTDAGISLLTEKGVSVPLTNKLKRLTDSLRQGTI